MSLQCGSEENFGGLDSTQVNPFLRGDEILWPLDKQRADLLAEFSLALSLAEALKRKLKVPNCSVPNTGCLIQCVSDGGV